METSLIPRQSLAVNNEPSALSGLRASVHRAAQSWLASKQLASNHLALPAVDNSPSCLSRSSSFRSSSFRSSSFRQSSFRSDVLERSFRYDDDLAGHEAAPIKDCETPAIRKKRSSIFTKAVRNISKLTRRKGKGPDGKVISAHAEGRGEGYPNSSVPRKAAAVLVSSLTGYAIAVGVESLNKDVPADGDFAEGVDFEDISTGEGGGDWGGGQGSGGGGGGGGDGFGDNSSKLESIREVTSSTDDQEEEDSHLRPRYQLSRPFASVNLPSQLPGSTYQSYPGSPPRGLTGTQEKFRQPVKHFGSEDQPQTASPRTETSHHLASIGPPVSDNKLPSAPPPAELEYHPGGAFSSVSVVPELSRNPEAVGPPLSEHNVPSEYSPAELEVHPGGSTARQESRQERGDFFEWISGFLQSLAPGGKGGNRNASTDDIEDERKDIIEQTAAQVMSLVLDGSGDEALAKKAETGALRRLQRETFSDLLKIKERLDKLELHTGLRSSRNYGGSFGVAKTKLTGQVNAGAAMVLMNGSSSRESRSALEQSGMLTGLQAQFKFETSFRDKDKLVTECVAGGGSEAGANGALGGAIALKKVAYRAEVSDRVTVSVAPFGGDSSDILQPVNPVQDVGLTSFSSNGPALVNHCKGSGIGAVFKGTRSVWSLSQYVRGWENNFSSFESPNVDAPLCLSTVAQVTAVPADFMAFSLSASNRYWPSPPLPSDHNLHWGEMGPLVLSRTKSSVSTATPRTSNGSVANGQLVNWSTSDLDMSGLDSQGTAMQSFALSGEAEVGPVNVGGWAQVDRGDSESENSQLQWAISIAKSAAESEIGGGLSIGQSRPDVWSSSRGEEDNFSFDSGHSQLQLEAFLRLNCGQGFYLQPGLLYVLNKQTRTPAIILKSSWSL